MGCQMEVVSTSANENTGMLKICEGLLYTWDSARTRWGVYTVADGPDCIAGSESGKEERRVANTPIVYLLKRYVWNVFAEGICVECCEGSCAARRKMSEWRLGRCWLVHTRVVVVVDHIVLIPYRILFTCGSWVPCAVCRVAGKAQGKQGGGVQDLVVVGFTWDYIYIKIIIIIITQN